MDTLEIFPWSDNFATGIDEIDAQHRRLVELLNALVRRMAYREESPSVGEVLRALEDYAAYHFTTEERVWREHLGDDPWTVRHEGDHAAFVARIGDVKASGGEEDEIVERLVSFLTNWLAQHIIEDDKTMATAVLALPTAASVAEAKAIATQRMAGATRTLVDTIMTMYDHLAVRTVHLTHEIGARARAEAAPREAQRELERQNAELRRLEAMRDGLVHMVVHDMRTPITAITLALEAARGDAGELAEGEAIALVDDARAHTARLARMASDLLDVSRMETRGLEPATRTCDLVALAASAIATVGRLFPDVHVALEGPGTALVTCDADMIRRVLENLVGNGLRHSPPGATVRVAIEPRGARVAVIVRDEGHGIPPEELPRLFEKFRAGVDRRGRRGVGLGLVFCRLAVAAHGGAIEVASPPGEGATFTFTLPAAGA
jgi:hemerythrin-like metal-binding protein